MNKAAKTEGSGQILYEENLKEHCEVAALILRTLPSTSNTRDHVKAAIRKASNQVSSVRGGNNHIKAFYMSSAAEAQMLLGKFDNLIGEHLVPVKVLVTKILSLPPQTIEWKDVREVVVQFSKMALITKAEDEILSSAGLLANMPIGWDGSDLLARYTAVGIDLKVNQYSSLRRSTLS